MAEIRIEKYSDEWAKKWDDFVNNGSMNGTFLQTRQFIEYHAQGRFKDHSLLFLRGNEVVCCVLACEIEDEGEKCFFSHKGTTFGGLIVSENVYSTSQIEKLFQLLSDYLQETGFDKIYLKQTPCLFSKKSTELVDYFLYQKGYTQFSELNYFLDLRKYQDDILMQFSSSKRRDYRYSLKNDLQFKKLETKEEIGTFHDVLENNLARLGQRCVHTTEELLDLKYNRFMDKIEFYGVFFQNKMIAGSMLFWFYDSLVHTQYLCSDDEYLALFPMDYLIYHLIEYAVEKGADTFTFGICTEDQGRYLNFGLSRFKEGFGVEYALNKSFEKNLKEK